MVPPNNEVYITRATVTAVTQEQLELAMLYIYIYMGTATIKHSAELYGLHMILTF